MKFQQREFMRTVGPKAVPTSNLPIQDWNNKMIENIQIDILILGFGIYFNVQIVASQISNTYMK